jgi:hypothetical protein
MLQVLSDRVLDFPGVELVVGQRRRELLRSLGHWLGRLEELTRTGAPPAVVGPLLRVIERLEGELGRG